MRGARAPSTQRSSVRAASASGSCAASMAATSMDPCSGAVSADRSDDTPSSGLIAPVLRACSCAETTRTAERLGPATGRTSAARHSASPLSSAARAERRAMSSATASAPERSPEASASCKLDAAGSRASSSSFAWSALAPTQAPHATRMTRTALMRIHAVLRRWVGRGGGMSAATSATAARCGADPRGPDRRRRGLRRPRA